MTTNRFDGLTELLLCCADNRVSALGDRGSPGNTFAMPSVLKVGPMLKSRECARSKNMVIRDYLQSDITVETQ